MAILSQIRERSVALIAVIGLALFAFVASPKDIIDFFSSSKVDSVGEVNGEVISRKEFALQVEAYKSNVGSNVTETQAVNAVWNSVLSEKIFKSQLEEAGIVVGEKDIFDAIIQNPQIQNAPIFKNEIGLFDEDKFKSYIANLKSSSDNQANSAWLNWLQNEKSVKTNLERAAYTQLVRYGVGASLAEGKSMHIENKTQLSGSYVFVPYTAIKDEDVEVSTSEVESYIAAHKSQFKSEASRDIKYVSFDIKASKEDEAAYKDDLNYIVPAFVKAQNDEEFVLDNGTDIELDDRFLFKNNLPTVIAEEVFKANKGNVVGPYKFQNHYRISKVQEFAQLPDSVQASHILISFVGSRSADATVTRTEAEAKSLADSIAKVAKRSASKFKSLAKDFSADKSNANNGGELNWFTYNQMVPEFRDYAFFNKRGSVGVVKTIFGYHVVKVTGRKNVQKAVRIATIAKKIEASEATENTIFEQAESLAYAISNGASIDDTAKEKNYIVRPLVGIKAMDYSVAGLGNNRSIVRWTFDADNSEGDVKRFDLEKGYAVVVLSAKNPAGVKSASAAASTVKPILVKEKKAALIAAKMNGTSLAAIAADNSVSVTEFSNLTMGAPTISGVGIEPGVVGAIYAVKEGELTKNVVGEKGVFAFKVTSKVAPEALSSYEGAAKSLATQNQGKQSRDIFNSLKDLTEIKDNRAAIY